MKIIKFRNKFTKARYPLRKRLCIYLSNRLLELSATLPKFQGGLIARLQTIDEHRKTATFSVARPNDVNIEFLYLWIFETFLIGESEELRQGLQSLFDDFSKSRYIIPRKVEQGDIDEIFKKMGESLLGLSWHRIGLIDILGNKDKVKSKRNWIEHFDLCVHHHSPSFVTVSFGVEPTIAFKNIVRNAILQDIPHRVEFKFPKSLKRLKLWFTFPAYSKLYSPHVKRELIENLMLEFKFEAVEIISRYLKGFFVRSGAPMPNIELFVENSSASQEADSIESESEKKSLFFWDSLGMNKRDFGYFKSEQGDIGIFLIDRHTENVIDKPFKLLIDKRKIVENLKSSDDIDARIIYDSGYYVEALTPILITKEILQLMLRENMSINKLLLNKASFKQSFLDIYTFKKLISLKQKINNLHLPFKRILLEFEADWIRTEAKATGLPRLINNLRIDKQNNKNDFLTVVIDKIKFETKVAKENFEFINTAVNELLQAETVESNYKIQRRILYLTIVIALLTVITALPEEMRGMLFSYFTESYREIIRQLIKK